MKRLRLIALLLSLFLVGSHYVFGVTRSLVDLQHQGLHHVSAKKLLGVSTRDSFWMSQDDAVDNNDEDNDHDDPDYFRPAVIYLLKYQNTTSSSRHNNTIPEVFSRFRQHIICLLPDIYLFQRSILV